jgi:hypothetical protein
MVIDRVDQRNRLIKAMLLLSLIALVGTLAYLLFAETSTKAKPNDTPAHVHEKWDGGVARDKHASSQAPIVAIQPNAFVDSRLVIQVVFTGEILGVAGVAIRLQAPTGIIFDGITDDFGNASFDVLAIKGQRVWASFTHPEYIDSMQELVANPGDRKVEMNRGVVVQGTATNRLGEVPPGARVYLAGVQIVERGESKPRIKMIQSVEPDASGSYRFAECQAASECTSGRQHPHTRRNLPDSCP